MPARLILAIDQGTTNTKALLVDRSGAAVFRASEAVRLIHTAAGEAGSNAQEFVEQDPMQLWQSVVSVMRRCHAYADEAGATIEAISISNQRETALAWDRASGQPAAHAISWQCRRSAGICDRLVSRAGAIRSITGLPLAPLLTAGKWAWMLEHVPGVQQLAQTGNLALGTIDSWLIHQLTLGATHATDLTNASRTGLLNLSTLAWDESLLDLFHIPRAGLPQLRPSSGIFGTCTSVPGFEGIPIAAAIGDSHAALVGHGSYRSGTVKATYGTGSSLMALSPTLAADTPALARTVAWSIGSNTQFALEGNIAMTGSAVQWVGEFLVPRQSVDEVVALASSVPDAAGLYFVPAMNGLGAPWWDSAARGVITGLGRAHTAAHLARAAVDAVAYQVADVFHVMEQTTAISFDGLHADGGATRNAALMQFQADILGRPVLRSSQEDLSALGAAWLAGIALGWWAGLQALEALPHLTEAFSPALPASTLNRLYRGWQLAVRQARLREEALA